MDPNRKKAKYHHGDLRAMLVEAAIDFLKDRDAGALSVRTLAKSLGVSEAAPYHHFPDRQAFEHAVMVQGYTRLQERCETVLASGGTLGDLLAAYVGFAVDHPNLFRLIHRSGAARDPANADLYRHSQAAFDPLLGEVKRRAAVFGIGEPARIGFLALMVWTQVHGLAEIVLTDFLRLGAQRQAFCLQAYTYIDASLEAALRGPFVLPGASS